MVPNISNHFRYVQSEVYNIVRHKRYIQTNLLTLAPDDHVNAAANSLCLIELPFLTTGCQFVSCSRGLGAYTVKV